MKEVFSNHGKPLIEMAMSFMHSRVICAAARLELADELGLGPCSAVRLADKCSADPDALHRLLRALAALGIVREDEPGTFTLTDAGEPLQKTAANSVWPAVIFWARPDGRWMVAPDGKRAHGTDRRRDHAA
jgi:Dimerisation domain